MSFTKIDMEIAEYKLRKKREAAKERSAKRYEEIKAERSKLRNPCRFVMTGNRGSKNRTLVIRCYCMSGYRFSPHFYGYDPLGIVSSITEARQLWEAHCQAMGGCSDDLSSL